MEMLLQAAPVTCSSCWTRWPARPTGISAHADFMEAWDPTIRNTFTQNCIRGALECGVRPLGDGTELTYLNSLSGLPGA